MIISDDEIISALLFDFFVISIIFISSLGVAYTASETGEFQREASAVNQSGFEC